MKTIYNLLCAGAILLGFAACGNDPEAFGEDGGAQPGTPKAVQLRIGIVQTRTTTDAAYKTTFVEGDAVGVFAVRHSVQIAATGNYADNLRFTYSGGTWSCAEGDDFIFPSDGSSLDFYAYYPYRENADPTNFTFTTAADQRAADFYAANDLMLAQTPNKRNETVTLSFRHALALVNVEVVPQNLPAFDNSMEVSLHNCIAAASVDLSTGIATVSGSSKTDILMSRVESQSATTYNYRALVPAQTVAEGTILFSFMQETPGSEIRYNYSTMAAKELAAGGVGKWKITIGGGSDLPIYAVGDYYPDATNPEGVVFEVSDGGTHGKVVYLKEPQGRPNDDYKCTRWGISDFLQSENGAPSMTSLTDGATATLQLLTARRNDPNFASDYSAFNYVYQTCNASSLDGSWYLPAVEELKSLYAAVNGLVYADIAAQWIDGTTLPGHSEGVDNNPAAAQAFCKKITDIGGDIFNFYGWYCSSTEVGASSIRAVHFDEAKVSTQDKNNEWAHVRPIRKF